MKMVKYRNNINGAINEVSEEDFIHFAKSDFNTKCGFDKTFRQLGFERPETIGVAVDYVNMYIDHLSVLEINNEVISMSVVQQIRTYADHLQRATELTDLEWNETFNSIILQLKAYLDNVIHDHGLTVPHDFDGELMARPNTDSQLVDSCKLTKRQQLAGLALQGILSADMSTIGYIPRCALEAVKAADALIKRLEE